MKELETVSEDYVVAKFLEAELDSPRFAEPIHSYLSEHNLPERLIREPDFSSEPENTNRREVLEAARGYLTRPPEAVFHGFPTDVSWSRITLQTNELGDLWTSSYPNWITISKGTRKVRDAADFIMESDPSENPARFVRDLVSSISADDIYPPIILVTDDQESRVVLFEGSVRTISFWLARDKIRSVDALLGRSPKMSEWCDF